MAAAIIQVYDSKSKVALPATKRREIESLACQKLKVITEARAEFESSTNRPYEGQLANVAEEIDKHYAAAVLTIENINRRASSARKWDRGKPIDCGGTDI